MVVLKIIGVLLLIIFMTACLPISLCVKYDRDFSISVRFLFLRFEKDFGKRPKRAQSEAPAQERKPESGFKRLLSRVSQTIKRNFAAAKSSCKKAAGKAKGAYHRLGAKLGLRTEKKKVVPNPEKEHKKRDFWGTLEMLVGFGKILGGELARIYKGIAAPKFTLRAEIVGDDAADTAIKYGCVCSAAFPMLSVLLGSLRWYNKDIEIIPNFDGNKGKLYFEGEFIIYPILVIIHAVGAVVKFIAKALSDAIASNKKTD